MFVNVGISIDSTQKITSFNNLRIKFIYFFKSHLGTTTRKVRMEEQPGGEIEGVECCARGCRVQRGRACVSVAMVTDELHYWNWLRRALDKPFNETSAF